MNFAGEKMPVVVAPHGSGVTQTHLSQALDSLIVDRIHDEAAEVKRIGGELERLGKAVENRDAPCGDFLSDSMSDLTKLCRQLAEVFQRLESRTEALARARSDAQDATPNSNTLQLTA